ncbi:hypothetical protein GN956_G11275 [Arapaima gigas]
METSMSLHKLLLVSVSLLCLHHATTAEHRGIMDDLEPSGILWAIMKTWVFGDVSAQPAPGWTGSMQSRTER